MSAQQDQIRRRVLFSGTVQGVGFRYTTVQVARRFDVTGFVRNLPDGRVEMVAEGAPDDVAGLVGAVQDEMSGYIRGAEQSDMAATGEFEDFSVRF